MNTLAKLSTKELEKEKTGYYDEDKFAYIEKKIPNIEYVVDEIFNKLGEPDGEWARCWPGGFEGMKKDHIKLATHDGTQDGAWWNLNPKMCQQICNCFGLKYHKNTTVQLYHCEYDNILNIKITVELFNTRHPNWKGLYIYHCKLFKKDL